MKVTFCRSLRNVGAELMPPPLSKITIIASIVKPVGRQFRRGFDKFYEPQFWLHSFFRVLMRVSGFICVGTVIAKEENRDQSEDGGSN
jgi:hypothetical protein